LLVHGLLEEVDTAIGLGIAVTFVQVITVR
jgi:Na+-transporting NADH:ubiquinone oxidoreductase subunit NqrE